MILIVVGLYYVLVSCLSPIWFRPARNSVRQTILLRRQLGRFQARSKDQEILEEGGGAGPSS